MATAGSNVALQGRDTASTVVLPPVLPLADVRAPGDRFRCEPYRCAISASSCAARQARAEEHGAALARTNGLGHCIGCADGARVVAAIGGAVARRRCSRAGCTRPATLGADLCAPHARFSPQARAAAAARNGLGFGVTESGRSLARAKPAPPAPAAPLPLRPPAPASAPPTPAPAAAPKPAQETPMAKPTTCSRNGCTRPAYEANDEGLCLAHHKGALVAKSCAEKRAQGIARGAVTKASTIARNARDTKAAPSAIPAAPRAAKAPARAAAKASPSASDLDAVLARAREALDLVETIGWDFARAIAARVSS